MNLPMIVVFAVCLIGIMLMMAHLAYLDEREKEETREGATPLDHHPQRD